MTKKNSKPRTKKSAKADKTSPSTNVGGAGGSVEGNTNQPVDASTQRGNQIKHWFFTWNNHTEDNIRQMLESFHRLCYRWRFEEEVGASGTKHLQGVCSVKAEDGIRWNQFGLPNTIHWEKTRNLIKAARYCEKDFVTNGTRLWEHGFPARLKLITELRPFQNQLLQMLDAEPDDRHIVVVYDPKGEMGKTQFMKYYLGTGNAGCFTTGGDYKDIACTINLYFQDGREDINKKWTFFMALARDQNMYHISYRALEGIKDGFMSSNKYESRGLIFNSPHVFMFTNNLPITTRLDGTETMTKSRWQVYTINEALELVIYEPWYEDGFVNTVVHTNSYEKNNSGRL